jgi:D-proline reductase (dithiol) PrdB
VTVNAYRFVDKITRKMVESWNKKKPQREPLWTPLSKPLSECTVACIRTAAIALHDDAPFDQETERRDPWWGDPSQRMIPQGTKGTQVRCWHLHIDGSHAEQDLNCVMPLDRLEELAKNGEIGRVAPRH